MSLTSRRTTGDGDTTTTSEEKETILPSTVRADGSVRKPVRIRAGYVNQFEVKKYVSPALRKQQQQEEKEEGEEKREEERTASSAKSSSAGVVSSSSSSSSNTSSNNANNSNNMTAAQKKNAKRREKKRLEAQQQQQGEREKIKEEHEQERGEVNDEEQEYLKTEIKHLRKQLQQCERIERKRMEDESKVRPSEWEKLGEYDETVDALEKLQRDLANLQFPAPEETKKDPKE
jgi:partner of Y14 and mago protein